MMDGDSKPVFKQRKAFMRPRAREGGKKTIRTYSNPFAAKAKKKNTDSSFTMQDIVNDNSDNLRLKEENTIRKEVQSARS